MRTSRSRRLEDRAGALDRVALNLAAQIGLGDEREHGRGVAQARAVVGPRGALVALGFERVKRRGESLGRTRPVAEHRERRGELRLAERRCEGFELGVGKIAQIADHGPPVAGENVERVSQRLSVVLARLRGVHDLVAQPIERRIERQLRHDEIALPRAGEEVGHEGVEPGIVIVAVGAPHAEGAARALAAELALDRAADPPVEIGIDAEVFDRGQPVGVEERHGDAHRLLRAAIGVALKGQKQCGRVERAERRSGDRNRAGPGNELGDEIA